MLSATWQQSSQFRDQAHQADPENRLLWRMPRRRLDFEPLRDRWLTASGQLDRQIGGRSVKIHEDGKRRGLYAYVDREDVPRLLSSFDVPSPDASQAIRAQTTVPQQALYMLNSPLLIDQARVLAALSMPHGLASQRVDWLYQQILSRRPNLDEVDRAVQFVMEEASGSQSAGGESAKGNPSNVGMDHWAQLAQILLASNEFAFVD
jgi:hypothetical protein